MNNPNRQGTRCCGTDQRGVSARLLFARSRARALRAQVKATPAIAPRTVMVTPKRTRTPISAEWLWFESGFPKQTAQARAWDTGVETRSTDRAMRTCEDFRQKGCPRAFLAPGPGQKRRAVGNSSLMRTCSCAAARGIRFGLSCGCKGFGRAGGVLKRGRCKAARLHSSMDGEPS